MHPNTIRQMEREAEYTSQLKRRILELETKLKSIVDHWREFGPEHGLDETIERACQVLQKPDKTAP